MIAAVMGIWALVLVTIAVRWPQHLVPAAIVCSVFEGAAIVNAGGLGISPYYFTLLLIAGHCVLLRVSTANFFGFTAGVRSIMAVAFTLLTLCVGSAVLMPRVFAGWPVFSPRLTVGVAAPLEFSTSNIGQAVYLLLNVMMLWYTAQTLCTPAASKRIVKAFLGTGVLVVSLAGYQLLSSLTGLPFPDDLLYSNDAYVMQHGTAILDMPRICSTFTEPSSLAVFLVCFIAFLIPLLETSKNKTRGIVLLLASLVTLMLSTSSTAYVGLAALMGWAIWRYIFVPAYNGRGSVKAALAISVVIGATVTTFIVNDALRDVIQKMVFEKDQSDSYEERTMVDHWAVHLAEESWGLGVGLGSNRASSFLPSLFSSIGVVGAGVLAWLIFVMVRSRGVDESVMDLHKPLAMSLLAILGAKMISSPDLATPGMWTLMAGLLSVRGSGEVAYEPAMMSIQQPVSPKRTFGVMPARSI